MGGANTNPTPVELKVRLRLLLLGASPAVAAGSRSQPSTSGAAVAMEEESPAYLSATVLADLGDGGGLGDTAEDDLHEIGELLEESQSQRQPAGHSAAAGSEFSRAGLEYVAGFLAFKLHSVDSSLGARSSQCPSGEAGADCPWLERLNRGGLYRPSPQWLQQVEAFDVVFCAMHGSDIDRGPGVIRRLREDLERKYPRIDPRVVRKYAVTRTHLRCQSKAE